MQSAGVEKTSSKRDTLGKQQAQSGTDVVRAVSRRIDTAEGGGQQTQTLQEQQASRLRRGRRSRPAAGSLATKQRFAGAGDGRAAIVSDKRPAGANTVDKQLEPTRRTSSREQLAVDAICMNNKCRHAVGAAGIDTLKVQSRSTRCSLYE